MTLTDHCPQSWDLGSRQLLQVLWARRRGGSHGGRHGARHSSWSKLFQLLFLLAILLSYSSGHARNSTFTDHGSMRFDKDVKVFWRIRPEPMDEEGHFVREFGSLEMTVMHGKRSWKVSVPTETREAPEWFDLGVDGRRVLRVPWVVRRVRVEGSVVLIMPTKSRGPAFLTGPRLEMNDEPPVYGRINGRRQVVALLINVAAETDGLLFEGEYHGSNQTDYLRCSRVFKARIIAVDTTRCWVPR